MTTPRVTVPEAIEALKHCIENEKAHWSLTDICDPCVDVPVKYLRVAVERLSAAPAPEGGAVWFGVTGAEDEAEALAVALFDARCPGVRMEDEDLHYYRAAAQRAMQAVTDELDTPALATREEAPAPCKSCNGSGMDAGSRFNRCPDCCGEAPVGEAVAWLRAELIGRDDSEQLGVSVRRLRELLRAQPVQIDPATVETAIGGSYDMPDGRKFWIDVPVAREMTNRVLAALQAEQKGGA